MDTCVGIAPLRESSSVQRFPCVRTAVAGVGRTETSMVVDVGFGPAHNCPNNLDFCA